MFNKIKLALVFLLIPIFVSAQSTPGFVFGQVPSTAQWNGYFGSKMDYAPGGIPVSSGGTGATTVPGAQSNLGIQIGSNVQAWSTALDSISALTGSANAIPYFTGTHALSIATASNPLLIPGAIVPNQTVGITGTTTNDSVQVGGVGEYVTLSSSNTLATGVTSNITSVALTPGDWDVTGVVTFVPTATTSITLLGYGISTVSSTLGAAGTFGQWATAPNVPGAQYETFPCPVVRISLAVSTTIYLVDKAVFSASTLTSFGNIRARRIR